VVEPVVSEQWFVKTPPLSEPALRAVKEGRAFIIPEAQEKEYYNWMENLHDWCISRQIWWGHQIPAWHCPACGRLTVSREDPTQCAHCGSDRIERDPDVLDTWFSSALWPFSTLGWPDRTPELERFYPNAAMITAYDILKFWVARMMMMGLHLMGEVPFTDIYLHGLVRDELGRKKSKTLGNFIDPIELIDEYGADALRFALAIETYIGRDVRLGEGRIQEAKKFINKVWNAARFTLGNLEGLDLAGAPLPDYSPADRWISSRLQKTIAAARDHVEHYRFHEMADSIYHFIWDELCDWYIEWAKPALYSPDTRGRRLAAQKTLVETLSAAVRLLHPVMPFFTEELYQSLPGSGASVMAAAYPEARPGEEDPALEARMAQVMEIVVAIRNIRSENLVPAGKKTRVTLIPDSEDVGRSLADLKLYLQSPPQVQIGELIVAAPGAVADKKAAIRRAGAVEVALDLAGVIDAGEEIARLDKEREKVEAELRKARAKLGNEAFLAKAPAEVRAKQERIQAECEAALATLADTRKRMEALKG
jgi:valyl-tRNA synthetase